MRKRITKLEKDEKHTLLRRIMLPPPTAHHKKMLKPTVFNGWRKF